jgi:hypothetical protein
LLLLLLLLRFEGERGKRWRGWGTRRESTDEVFAVWEDDEEERVSRMKMVLLSPRSKARAKVRRRPRSHRWLLLLRGHPTPTGNGAKGTAERSRRVGGWRADTADRSSLATAG